MANQPVANKNLTSLEIHSFVRGCHVYRTSGHLREDQELECIYLLATLKLSFFVAIRIYTDACT